MNSLFKLGSNLYPLATFLAIILTLLWAYNRKRKLTILFAIEMIFVMSVYFLVFVIITEVWFI